MWMSEFHLAEQGVFGRYCKIEMHRYVGPNEFYIHKCIGSHESNVWVDVPIHGNPKPRSHKEIAPVMTVITCGIDETQGFPVRACDVEMLPPEERTCHAVEELEQDGVGAPPRHTTHCSRCGQLWDETGGVPRCPAYCPACGARVTEGETDE